MPDNFEPDQTRAPSDAGMRMMTMMMLCCVGVVLLFAVIPLFPWPLGIAVGLTGAAALFFAHQKLMGHGSHH